LDDVRLSIHFHIPYGRDLVWNKKRPPLWKYSAMEGAEIGGVDLLEEENAFAFA
jgi:hypothetical protein